MMILHVDSHINLCVAAYQIIKSSDISNRGFLLRICIEERKREPPDNTIKLPTLISEQEEAMLFNQYGAYVNDKMIELLRADLDKVQFYTELAEFIFEDKGFLEEKARIVAIYRCILDRRLPYHKIDLTKAVTLDEFRFMELIDAVGQDAMETIKMLMSYPF